jgi:[FeFe] hydrogenase H-cluster maturation GTPase HydF
MIGLTSLAGLPRLRDYSSRRCSSYDRTGGNRDFWVVKPGEEKTLADIEGPGCIKHIWMTLGFHPNGQAVPIPSAYPRRLVLRAYWEGKEKPSVEAPVGDFFGLGHGMLKDFWSLPLQMSPSGGKGMNSWWPMPFKESGRITITNECEVPACVFFYIDHEIYPAWEDDLAYLHVQWRRENPTRGYGDSPGVNVRDIWKDPNHGEGNYVILDANGDGIYCGCHLDIDCFDREKNDWYGEGKSEMELYAYLEKKQIPFIVAINKTDLVNDKLSSRPRARHSVANAPYIEVSAKTHSGKEELLKAISTLASQAEEKKGPPLVGDLFDPGDRVILVIPLDAQAPKGRLILPQVQTIRDILDHGGIAIAVGIEQLKQLFSGKDLAPRLVITDSQAFKEVDRIVPPTIPLTSFSILFARHKGNFDLLVKGAQALDQLRPGDHVLIAEACTHHAIGDDIGTVKIPRLLNTKVGGELNYEWQKGGDYPEDLARSQAVIHCGGCMLNSKAMCSRLKAAAAAGVSITNYGMTIAACYGILPRALEAFQW